MGANESFQRILSAGSKRHAELYKDEMEIKYKFEEKRLDLVHQHEIANLMTQMKLKKCDAGKEFLLTYMQTMTSIIQQNSSVFEKAIPLIQYISNDKTPDSIKKAAEKAINRAFEGYKSTHELLEFSKAEAERLSFKQDTEFCRMLDVAVGQKIITDENKAYILE
ncbi:6456_t:CDS:2 [Ambispora gerdemannii]|uniref:6456_t:CDS:1 n=1 Tax=Ambispora gerdemannii TaxID=144530 RepID=A0A9N9FQQ2_9GLOM|nr:6456_t:CDS:2 [Ambispora gerdemannii]